MPVGVLPAADRGAAAAGARGVIRDVWSRTTPKYRIRAAFALGVTLLLYVALCAFSYWLHTTRVVDFSAESFLEPFRFWGEQTRNLNDFLRYPISVERTPIHGIVLGLLVASIIAVPVLVAILYRFPAALPFTAATCLFAHMPWMALTLTLGCLLAAVRPFRMSFRYGSALVALLPMLLYLYLATWSPAERPDAALSPSQQTAMYAPWVLAVLAACGMMALVLLIARAVDYRPGAIAPVMLLMSAAPVVLFFRYVGQDELHYRVFEAEFGPRSARFQTPLDARAAIARMVDAWISDEGVATHRAALEQVWAGQVEGLRQAVQTRMTRGFLADRASAYRAARQFIAAFPGSRYVPCVLFIEGRVLDTRLDAAELVRSARRELYSDFPHVQSEASWTALLHRYPESSLAVSAAIRLAQLRLRGGDVEDAARLLRRAVDRSAVGPTSAPRAAVATMLSPDAPEHSLNVDPEPLRAEAERLLELIERNRSDPRYGTAPLAELASLDPRLPHYADELLRLAERFPGCELCDNVLVRWARALGDPTARRRALLACLREFAGGDAQPEALFHLAEIEIQSLGRDDPSIRAAGLERLRELAGRFDDSCWGRAAAARLRTLEPAVAAAGP